MVFVNTQTQNLCTYSCIQWKFYTSSNILHKPSLQVCRLFQVCIPAFSSFVHCYCHDDVDRVLGLMMGPQLDQNDPGRGKKIPAIGFNSPSQNNPFTVAENEGSKQIP